MTVLHELGRQRASNPEYAQWLCFTDDVLSTRHWSVESNVAPSDVDGYEAWLKQFGLWVPILAYARTARATCHLAERITNAAPGLIVESVKQSIFCSQFEAEIASIFQRHGVRCLFLKGAILERLLYPESHFRTRCDLDIFIADEDAPKAHELLRASDYTLQRGSNHGFVSNAFDYQKQMGPFTALVDVHWQIRDLCDYQQAFGFERVYASASAYACGYSLIREPVKTDLLLHACIHWFHDHESFILRQLWEMLSLVRLLTSEESESFVELVQPTAIDTDCRLAVATAYRAFGAEPENSVIRVWLGALMDIDFEGLTYEQALRHQMRLDSQGFKNQEGWWGRGMYILSRCFPHPRYIRNNLCPALRRYPEIYAKRLVYGARRALSARIR